MKTSFKMKFWSVNFSCLFWDCSIDFFILNTKDLAKSLIFGLEKRLILSGVYMLLYYKENQIPSPDFMIPWLKWYMFIIVCLNVNKETENASYIHLNYAKT
jgi:hypothetical protein